MPSPKKTIAVKKTPAKKVATKKTATKIAKVEKKEPEVEMKVFTCKACNKKFQDMGLYFYGKKSEKCLWCKKFPSRNTPKT